MPFFFRRSLQNKTTHLWGPPDWLIGSVIGEKVSFDFRKSPPKPYFEILYLDHDLRVHKTGQGNVFVQEPKRNDVFFSEKRQMCHVIIVGGFPVLLTKTKLGTQIQLSTIQWNETLVWEFSTINKVLNSSVEGWWRVNLIPRCAKHFEEIWRWNIEISWKITAAKSNLEKHTLIIL